MERVGRLGTRPIGRIRTAAVQGMMWLAGERVGVQVVDQLFTIILVRLLLPRDFGILAAAAIFTSLLRIFANMGLGAAIIQRAEIDDEYLSTAFWANLAMGLGLTLVAAILGEFVGRFMGDPMIGLVVLVLAVRFIITAGSTTQSALISRHMDYRTITTRSLKARGLGGLVGVGMALSGLGFWSLVGQQMSATVAGTILLYRATGWRPRLRFSWPKFIDLWSFSAPLLLARLFGYAVRHTDNLLVGRYLGATALGFYALGYSLFLGPLNETGIIVNRVMFSALSRVKDDAARLRRAFVLATKYVTMLGLPMMVGLALVAPQFVEVVFGARWRPTAPVLSILAFAGFLQSIMTLGPSSLQAAGRPDLQLRWAMLAAVLYLPAFALGLRWGIVGVATGYLVATCLLMPVQLGFVTRTLKVSVRELWVALRGAIAGCLIMALGVAPAAWGLRASEAPAVVALLGTIALGVVLYGASVWLMNRQALRELLQIARQATVPARRVPAGEVEV